MGELVFEANRENLYEVLCRSKGEDEGKSVEEEANGFSLSFWIL